MVTCKEYVKNQKELLSNEIKSFKRKPKLCVIQISDDSASNSYVRGKERDCLEVGIEFEHIHIIDYKDFSQVITRIGKIIYDQKFSGAASGFFNANIIARDLGLADKKEIDADVKQEIKSDIDRGVTAHS